MASRGTTHATGRARRQRVLKAGKRNTSHSRPGGLITTDDGRKSGALRFTRRKMGVSRKVFARLSGVSERTLVDVENERRPLSATHRRQLVEMDRLGEALAEVMKPEFVGQWLESPNEAFDGLKPVEVVERGEIDRIWELLHRIGTGMPT